tara:strand:- start:2507 stop:3442 length:936 start_codon:yes stop_codon:yes gene_type:complete
MAVQETTFEDYMNNDVVEDFQPFYINAYKNGEWTNGGKRFRMQEAYGISAFNENPADIDYIAVAVKAGFKVEIAIESSSITRWNGFDLGANYETDVIGAVGGNQFLRFTMTAGGFIEISGGMGNDWSDLYSVLENQLDEDANRADLQQNHQMYRVRFSADGNQITSFESIKGDWITGNVMAVILDGVERIPEEEEGGVLQSQAELVPEGEEATTREDIGVWELIQSNNGQEWNLVKLNNETESATWAFYFNGSLISAFADKNDALIALNFHHEQWLIEQKDEDTVLKYDSAMALIYSVGLVFATRFLRYMI